MAVIGFGHSWWGRKWLQSLTHIDFENRLPRGQRYARNGSVTSIDIKGHKVSARVAGRRPQPYKVSLELWPFSRKEQELILDLIRASSYYLSQLEARILPEELHDELEKKGIRLFPRSWEELKMRCSCPDWAVPCKHLAAVVYLIANEIDKNPFLVFELHDFDLMDALHPEGRETSSILGIQSFLEEKEEFNYYREKLETIDYSRIPDLSSAITGLLTDFPLFYLKKDFKLLLTEGMKRNSRLVKKHIKNLKLTEERPEQLYTRGEWRLLKGDKRFSGELKRGKESIGFDSRDCGELFEYFQGLSAGDLSLYPEILSYLIMVNNFTLKLLEKQALVPEIYNMGDERLYIRWIPALFNPEINNIFDSLKEALPRTLVRLGKTALEGREQLLFLISFMVDHYHDLFQPVKKSDEDPVLSLFYNGREFKPLRFEEREIGNTIHLWLGRFFIRPINLQPVIHIEEAEEDKFLFSIRIKDRSKEEELPVNLKQIVESDHEEKLPLLRDLNLLSTYLPLVNQVLKSLDAVEARAESFLENWFKALAVFRTLGIQTVLPRCLKDVFVPQLTLDFRMKGKQEETLISYTGLQEMMDFQWTMAVGDDFISAEDFLELLNKYRGIVRYKDSYLVLDDKEMEKIRKQLEKEASLGSLDLLKIHLEERYQGIPIQTDDTLKTVFNELFTPGDTTIPEGLNATLRPYQEAGYRWLYHNCKIGLGALIADDMGLGKTIQVITLLLKFKEEGRLTAKHPALVVVPAALLSNWEREIGRFAPALIPSVYHGPGRELDRSAEVVITTYAVVHQDLELLKKIKFTFTVLDEAQNIKTPDAGRTKSVKTLKSDVRIAMTGTPVENKLLDYWSVLDFIMKNLMGNKIHFKEKFAVPIERFRDRDALNSFRKLTSPFILRRMKTDKTVISDLPDKIVNNMMLPLSTEQAALYEGLVDQVETLLESLDGIKRSGVVFKLIGGLKQICDHPSLYLKKNNCDKKLSGKTEALTELLDKIFSTGEKALIFTQFTGMGDILKSLLENEYPGEVPFYHGGCSRKQRDEMVREFQDEKDCRVMIISLKAGGVGLNLTAANHVIHYDLWWNPAVENQATDRAYRIGQMRNVNVHRMISRGSFEEKINTMLESKQELADLTVAQGEKWITQLSTSDLKDLLKLERE